MSRLEEKMKDKKHKNYCSQHCVVHKEKTCYWSCSFPNDEERNRKFKEWRKNPDGLIDM